MPLCIYCNTASCLPLICISVCNCPSNSNFWISACKSFVSSHLSGFQFPHISLLFHPSLLLLAGHTWSLSATHTCPTLWLHTVHLCIFPSPSSSAVHCTVPTSDLFSLILSSRFCLSVFTHFTSFTPYMHIILSSLFWNSPPLCIVLINVSFYSATCFLSLHPLIDSPDPFVTIFANI